MLQSYFHQHQSSNVEGISVGDLNIYECYHSKKLVHPNFLAVFLKWAQNASNVTLCP